MIPDCFTEPQSWDDIARIAERCGGANWMQQAWLGFEALVAVFIFAAVLAACVVKVRPR